MRAARPRRARAPLRRLRRRRGRRAGGAARRRPPVAGRGRARQPRAWLITVALAAADRPAAGRPGPGRARERSPALAADVVDARPSAAGRGERDDSLTLLLLCCHPALTPPVAGGAHAAGGRRPQHGADRPRLPGARGDDGAADQPGEGRLARSTRPSPCLPPASFPTGSRRSPHVLYLVFTEGHTATTGRRLTDVSLADEAIRLTRRLHAHLPGDDEVSRAARADAAHRRPAGGPHRRRRHAGPAGRAGPLALGPRLIAEGVALVEAALPSGPVGPYQLQAAIAAVHAEAADAERHRLGPDRGPLRMLAASRPAGGDAQPRGRRRAGPRPGGRRWPCSSPCSTTRRCGAPTGCTPFAPTCSSGPVTRTRPRRRTPAARLATSIPEQRYLLARAAANGPEA